jgi:hypothetical protein
MNPPTYLRDCDELTATKLRAKYRVESNSHKGMLDRRKDGALVADELVKFADFLRLVGPCPKEGHTLDRLNNDDPEYASAKIQWRSKTDQSRNRRNVIYLTDSDGARRTLAEWGELTGQPRYTLHSRRRRGLTDAEVIHGPNSTSSKSSPRALPWPKGRETQWEERYRREAWTLHIVDRRELRVEFFYRIASETFRELIDEAERTVNPYVEPGPEHDKLLVDIDEWGRELKRSALLLRQTK